MGNPQKLNQGTRPSNLRRGDATVSYIPNVLQIALGIALYVFGGQQSGPLNNPLFLAWAFVALSGVGLAVFGFLQIGKKRARAGR